MKIETRAWVELTETDNISVWVNLANVDTMRVHANSTLLKFREGSMPTLSVKEQPRDILRRAGLA